MLNADTACGHIAVWCTLVHVIFTPLSPHHSSTLFLSHNIKQNKTKWKCFFEKKKCSSSANNSKNYTLSVSVIVICSQANERMAHTQLKCRVERVENYVAFVVFKWRENAVVHGLCGVQCAWCTCVFASITKFVKWPAAAKLPAKHRWSAPANVYLFLSV